MGLGIAIRAFSAGLFNRRLAEEIAKVLEGDGIDTPEPKIPPPTIPSAAAPPAPSPRPARSDAVTLLSALQREARLVDLIQEDLTKFQMHRWAQQRGHVFSNVQQR